jgi:hypothetical protein
MYVLLSRSNLSRVLHDSKFCHVTKIVILILYVINKLNFVCKFVTILHLIKAFTFLIKLIIKPVPLVCQDKYNFTPDYATHDARRGSHFNA